MSTPEHSDDFNRLVYMQAERHDYDPATGELIERHEPGTTEVFSEVETHFVGTLGYTPDGFLDMCRLALDEVREMRRELDEITPDDFR